MITNVNNTQKIVQDALEGQVDWLRELVPQGIFAEPGLTLGSLVQDYIDRGIELPVPTVKSGINAYGLLGKKGSDSAAVYCDNIFDILGSPFDADVSAAVWGAIPNCDIVVRFDYNLPELDD